MRSRIDLNCANLNTKKYCSCTGRFEDGKKTPRKLLVFFKQLAKELPPDLCEMATIIIIIIIIIHFMQDSREVPKT